MTKKILTALGLAALTCLTALVVPARVAAANQQDAMTAVYDASSYSDINLGAANINDCVNIFYVGTSTESVVTITATAMTFYTPGNVLDTSIGTAGVVTYSSTLGANTIDGFCSYLNGLNTNGPGGKSTYQCYKTNCKGNDTPGVMFKTQTQTSGTNDLKAVGGFGILMTTNTTVQLGIQPAPGKRVVLKQVIANGAAGGLSSSLAANQIHIYGALRKYGKGKDLAGTAVNDTYSVWDSSSTNAVVATIPSSNALSASTFMEFGQDQHVVIIQGATGSGSAAAQTSANYINATWEER